MKIGALAISGNYKLISLENNENCAKSTHLGFADYHMPTNVLRIFHGSESYTYKFVNFKECVKAIFSNNVRF